MALFQNNLRRGLGTRSIPPGKPIPPQLMNGVAGHGEIGSFTTAGFSGIWSADFSKDFGIGGSNQSGVGVTVNLAGPAAGGAVGTMVHRLGQIPSVPATGAVGRFTIHTGANLAAPIYGASASGAAGSPTISLQPVFILPSAIGHGAVGSFAPTVAKVMPAVAGTGGVSTFSFSGTVTTLTSGTTFTIPGGITKLILIECWGAGGQGGNSWGNPQGGGGGAYASIANLTVTPGAVLSIQIGVGGSNSGGSQFGGGDSGTATWFKDTSTVLAAGGTGGKNDNTNPTNGGTTAASVGTTLHAGGSGGLGPTSPHGSGAGGGSAGPDGNGLDASAGDGIAGNGGAGDNGSGGAGGTGSDVLTGTATAAAGGANAKGGGGGGGAFSADPSGGDALGGAGALPGGGGGGQSSDTGATLIGGFGGGGQIRITY